MAGLRAAYKRLDDAGGLPDRPDLGDEAERVVGTEVQGGLKWQGEESTTNTLGGNHWMTPEAKTVPRGVLWMVVGLALIMVTGLLSLLLTMAGNWASMVDRRGFDNQARITVLERQFSAIEQQMNQNNNDHREIKDMLKDLSRGR